MAPKAKRSADVGSNAQYNPATKRQKGDETVAKRGYNGKSTTKGGANPEKDRVSKPPVIVEENDGDAEDKHPNGTSVVKKLMYSKSSNALSLWSGTVYIQLVQHPDYCFWLDADNLNYASIWFPEQQAPKEPNVVMGNLIRERNKIDARYELHFDEVEQFYMLKRALLTKVEGAPVAAPARQRLRVERGPLEPPTKKVLSNSTRTNPEPQHAASLFAHKKSVFAEANTDSADDGTSTASADDFYNGKALDSNTIPSSVTTQIKEDIPDLHSDQHADNASIVSHVKPEDFNSWFVELTNKKPDDVAALEQNTKTSVNTTEHENSTVHRESVVNVEPSDDEKPIKVEQPSDVSLTSKHTTVLANPNIPDTGVVDTTRADMSLNSDAISILNGKPMTVSKSTTSTQQTVIPSTGSAIGEQSIKGVPISVLNAYISLFMMFHGRVPELHKLDLTDRLRQVELILRIARYHGSLPIVRHYLSNALWENGRELLEAITIEPLRFMKIAISLKNVLIFKEAMVHYVGQHFRDSDEQTLSLNLCNETKWLIIEKNKKLKDAHMHFIEKMSMTPIFRNGQQSYNFEVGTGCPETWHAVQFWRDSFFNRIEACKMGQLALADFYRRLATDGSTFLTAKDMLDHHGYLFKTELEPKQQHNMEESLDQLKRYAQEEVKCLVVHNSIIDITKVKWLTPTLISGDELPWKNDNIRAMPRSEEPIDLS